MEAFGDSARQTIILSISPPEDPAHLLQERSRVVHLVQFLFVEGIIRCAKKPRQTCENPSLFPPRDRWDKIALSRESRQHRECRRSQRGWLWEH